MRQLSKELKRISLWKENGKKKLEYRKRKSYAVCSMRQDKKGWASF
jgi:hypothetical protein